MLERRTFFLTNTIRKKERVSPNPRGGSTTQRNESSNQETAIKQNTLRLNMSLLEAVAPPVAQPQRSKLEDDGARFKPRSRLSTQPFGVFRGFLRNSRKYELGPFRQTPQGGHSTYRPRSLVRQLALIPITNQPSERLGRQARPGFEPGTSFERYHPATIVRHYSMIIQMKIHLMTFFHFSVNVLGLKFQQIGFLLATF